MMPFIPVIAVLLSLAAFTPFARCRRMSGLTVCRHTMPLRRTYSRIL
ncbi:hypothetical protein BH23GEM6_BH23GEM6_24300 [soil metagenome]